MTNISLNTRNIPENFIDSFKRAAADAGIERIAIVGGIIRDNLFQDAFKESIARSKDIDICVEGSAYALAKKIESNLGKERASIIRINQSYNTVEMRIDDFSIDIASARRENYPSPGENPQVVSAKIEEDLYRRDFTINSIALDLKSNTLIDLHDGRHAIKSRQLKFIHSKSVEEDPTRIIRGARYASRLNLQIAPDSLSQIKSTLRRWPWSYYQGPSKESIPPALSTRLRMELELLFQEKSYLNAIKCLQEWGGLLLLDNELQNDHSWEQRLNLALKLGIAPLSAFIAKSNEATNIAERLQLAKKEQALLAASREFQGFFKPITSIDEYLSWKPSKWCKEIENLNYHPDVIGLNISLSHPLSEFFLHWLKDWRKVKSPLSAQELLENGFREGPLLKKELERLRFEKLDSIY